MLHGVIDQLGDQHRLAHASAAKQPGLAAALDGRQQIDGLDAGFQDFTVHHALIKRGWRLVNGASGDSNRGGLAVEGLAKHIEHASQHRITHRHLDRRAGGTHRHAQPQATHRRQRHAARRTVGEQGGDLHCQFAGVDQLLDAWRCAFEQHVHHAATDADDAPFAGQRGGCRAGPCCVAALNRIRIARRRIVRVPFRLDLIRHECCPL